MAMKSIGGGSKSSSSTSSGKTSTSTPTSNTSNAVANAKANVAAWRAKTDPAGSTTTGAKNFGTGSAEGGAVKTTSKTATTASSPAISTSGSGGSVGNTSSKIMSLKEKLKETNAKKTLAKQLTSPTAETGLERTDALISDIKGDQNENINFLDKTKSELIDKNTELKQSLDESNARQRQIIEERKAEQDAGYNKIMSTINESKNVDINKLNLTTNQNANALSSQLADAGLLNSEQAAQASATVISRANEQTQLKKLDIDQKNNELIMTAQQEYQNKRDAILAQQGVNENLKATQLAELNKTYTGIIETYNNNALNEKKAADNQETQLKQGLAEGEITGQQSEIIKTEQAKARLDKLENVSRSPEDKAIYLFSSLSNYFGSDVITDGVINSYISKLKENGTLVSVPLSTAFSAIKDQIITAQKSLKK